MSSETLGVRIGDRLRFLFQPAANSVELSVSGIYHTGLDALDREMAFSPLKMIPGEGFPWTAAVFLRSGVKADTLLDTFRQHWPDRIRFESWETQMPDLRQLIDLETVSMMIVIILFFGVVAIGVACSFVIFIIRNMREYGIMRAMGVTTTEMSSLIVAKVTLMNLVACSVGLLIGMLAVLVVAHTGGIDISAFTSHNRYFAVSGVITPRLTAFSLWAPPATSLLFSLFAAAWPAVMVARKKAADILRLI